MSSQQRNYYKILNSTPNATFDELKRNYKQLILQCHPDKLQKADKFRDTATDVDPNVSAAAYNDGDDDDDGDNDDCSEFVIINKAWNTLKDSAKRKQYDAELLEIKFQAHSNIFERLTLNDMYEHECTDIETATTTTTTASHDDEEDNLETYYAYNCRCGGQYIIDESAAKENGLYKSHQKVAIGGQQRQRQRQHQTHNNDCAASTWQDSSNIAADDVADIGNKNKVIGDTSDCEVMVECSECSLVIILSNVKRLSSTSS